MGEESVFRSSYIDKIICNWKIFLENSFRVEDIVQIYPSSVNGERERKGKWDRFCRRLSALLHLRLLQYWIKYNNHEMFLCVQTCCHENQWQNQALDLDNTHTHTIWDNLWTAECTWTGSKHQEGKGSTCGHSSISTEPLPDEVCLPWPD